MLRCRDAASFFQHENPLFRSFGARGFLFAFLLARLCELHRIRIVQAKMGLAGSRTSFSFPPNRKSFLSNCDFLHLPSCLPACTPYPAGHRLWLAVLYRGCVFVVTVFLLSKSAGFAALRDDSLHIASDGQQGTAPGYNVSRTEVILNKEENIMGCYHLTYSHRSRSGLPWRGFCEIPFLCAAMHN